ncbi:hypothetical protein TNCV_4163711 [Trichonephila clavipes]|nr:hypothetical protein TNCV_4163711 [Trichonephila clavipes]
MTATADSDVVQSGRPISDDFFQHLWLYIGNNTENVVFQMVKRLWLIRTFCGRGRLVVKVSDRGWLVTSSSPVPLKTRCSVFTAWGTLNSRRAISPLVRLVAGDERWEASDPTPWCSSLKLGWDRAKSYCLLHGAQS